MLDNLKLYIQNNRYFSYSMSDSQSSIKLNAIVDDIKEINCTLTSVLEHLGYNSLLPAKSQPNDFHGQFKTIIYNLLDVLPSRRVLEKCTYASKNEKDKKRSISNFTNCKNCLNQSLNIELKTQRMYASENQENILEILNETLGISQNFAGMAQILYRNNDDSQQEDGLGGIFTESDIYSLQRYFRRSYEKINQMIGILGGVKFINLEFYELRDQAIMSCLQHFTYIFNVQKAYTNPFKNSRKKNSQLKKHSKVNTNTSSSEQEFTQRKAKGENIFTFRNKDLISSNPEEVYNSKHYSQKIKNLEQQVKKLTELLDSNNRQFSYEIKRYNFKLYEVSKQIQAYQKEIEELDSQIFILEKERKQDEILIQALYQRLEDVQGDTKRTNFVNKNRGCKSSTQLQLQYLDFEKYKNQLSNGSGSHQDSYSIKDDHSSLNSLKINKVQSYGAQYIEQRLKLMEEEDRRIRQLAIVEEDLQESYSPRKVRVLNQAQNH